MTLRKLTTIAVFVALAGIALGLIAAHSDGSGEIQAIGVPDLTTPGEESKAETKTVVRTVPGRTVVVASQAGADQPPPDEPAEPKPEPKPEPDEPEAEPDVDLDDDGHPDDADNCPSASNPDQADFDGDGLGDVCDPDDDNDNLSDAAEGGHGTNPYAKDTDGDGWHDGNEVSAGTDPLDPNDHPEIEWCFGC